MALDYQRNRKPQNRRPPNARRPQKSRDEVRREQALKRRRKKKRKQIIFYTFSFLLLIIVGLILSLTVFFKVETITVEGKAPYNKDKVIKASGVKKQDNLFLTDKSKVIKNIKQKLPYVGEVVISNKLPNEIVIHIKSTTEKCAFKNGDKFVLTDDKGKVLQVGVEKVSPTLMKINGVNVKKAEIGKHIEFKNKESEELLNKLIKSTKTYKINAINKIDIKNKLNIEMTYQNRIDLLIGSASYLDKKMEFAAEVIKKENQRSTDQKGIIDLQALGSDKSSKEKVYFRVKDEKT